MPRVSRPSRAEPRPRKPPKTRPENRRVSHAPPRPPLGPRLRALFGRARPQLGGLKRISAVLLQLLAAAAVAVGLMMVGRLVLRHLETAPAFSTTRIDVEGAAQLTKAEVHRLAGLALGQNVFKVDAEEATAKLRAEPWIESATVQRRLPGTYHVVIKERRAVALLAAKQLFLVSEDGAAFKPLGRGDPADLPLITGLDPAAIERDKRGATKLLLQAVALLREYAEVGLARREPISEVRIDDDDSLSCFVGLDATYVRLGKPPYRSKLRRLREVFGQLASQRARAEYVYLDNERRQDRVTLKLR
jgi:cell division protein FtsQ